MRTIVSLIVFACCVQFITAQSVKIDSVDAHGNTIYIGKKPIRNFSIDGSYNGLIYYRSFDSLFDGNQAEEKMILSNSDGGGEQRVLRLNFSGRPTINTYFKSDMFVAPSMRGPGYNTATSDKLGVEIGVNLEAQIHTDNGTAYLKFGGTQFTKLSRLTLWSTENKGESMFERSPWGGFQQAGQNYESYYSQGTISRDFTWGNKFLQGFTADIVKLPYNLESKLIYAKTPNNGGQTSYVSNNFNMSYGGNIRKIFGMNYLGINSFNTRALTSDVNGKPYGYNVMTADGSYSFWQNDMVFSGEIGECRFVESTDLSENWAYAMDFSLLSKSNIISAPLTFHYYYIQPQFISLDAGFNTFLRDASANYNGEGGSGNAVGANISDIDYINGNRKGADVRTELNIEGLKVNLAYGISQEVEHLTNIVSYTHRINGIMFARVYPYRTVLGENESFNTTYRGYYETGSIDTTNPTYKPWEKLNFNTVECNLKYKINVLNKPLYMFYLGSLSTMQQDLSLYPMASDKAYMQIQYHEIESYYKVFEKVALAGYVGIETMKGNQYMKHGPNLKGKPTNAIGTGLGLGFDAEVSNSANVYVRGRWFDYKDKNNTFYTYKGFEGTVELRVYF